MKTIRMKIFMLFGVFMILLVISGIALNLVFLERYYLFANKNVFIQISKMISKEYYESRRNIPKLIRFIDRSENIHCTITKKNRDWEYNSFPQRNNFEIRKLPKEIEKFIVENQEKIKNAYAYSIVENTQVESSKLVFVSRMKDGELVILSKSLKGINESVLFANQFYIFAGLLIIIIGGIIIFIFSKKITRPIIEMSEVSESISNLNFNKRLNINSEDEVGSLARNINKISEKLSASMNELKQELERRKHLVRNISHELKTPIGVMKGYAEGLKYNIVEDLDKKNRYCTVISDECDRMDKMVHELLNFSMLDSGMFQKKISKVDLEEFINKITDRFEIRLAEKDITTISNCQKGLTIEADVELLEIVVNNYLINAINHSDGIKNIRISTESKDNGIRLSVFNTGKNIDDNDLKDIWDVFYKVDKARSREYGGHGIGLSIVKLIAELHGGIAGVENLKDGVVFYIEFP